MDQQCYFIGLDLAQASEYTALAVPERPVVLPRDQGQQRRPPYSLRHLKRFPVGTHYSVVAAAVRELLNKPPLSNCVLVVDQTGVGSSVMKLFEDDWMRRIICTFFPVTITAGQEAVVGPSGELQIPKKELVGVLQVLLQKRRLQVARTLPDAALLVNELENFRTTVSITKHDSFESWREGPHDDLVFAVALAAWLGEQRLPPLIDPPPDYPTLVYVR